MRAFSLRAELKRYCATAFPDHLIRHIIHRMTHVHFRARRDERRREAEDIAVRHRARNHAAFDLPYYDDVVRLAQDSDVLILTCPLSPATRHLVDAAVIDALGPRGFIVNISRGPVIDEMARVAALAADRIAGAALDVFEQEPAVPEALIQDRRLVPYAAYRLGG